MRLYTGRHTHDNNTTAYRFRSQGDYPVIPSGLGLQYEGIGKYSLWLRRNEFGSIEVVKARFVGVPENTIKLTIRAKTEPGEWVVNLEGQEVARFGFDKPAQVMWFELVKMAHHDLWPIGDDVELSPEDDFEW
jgi:hypothetical protein